MGRLLSDQSLYRAHSACHERLQKPTSSPHEEHSASLQLSLHQCHCSKVVEFDVTGAPLPGGPQTRRPPGAGPSRAASRQRLVWCSSGSRRASAGALYSATHCALKPARAAPALPQRTGLPGQQEPPAASLLIYSIHNEELSLESMWESVSPAKTGFVVRIRDSSTM